MMAVAVSLAVSCTENRSARITGAFPGAGKETEKVYLELVTTRDRTVVDSAEINQKGDFSFRVDLPSASPTFVNLKCKNNTIPLIVSPGQKVSVHSLGDLAHNYTVEGSDDSRLLKEFLSLYNDGIKTLDSLYYLYAETPGNTVSGEARRKTLLAEYSQAYYKTKRAHIAFIVSNANSMAALYALYQRLPNETALFNDAEDAIYYRVVADSLAARYPDSPHVQALQKDADARVQDLGALQALGERVGEPVNYPDIELSDIFGKTQRLSSLEGKVILLDFWSLTDGRSSVMNAELKELYGKYGGQGFEVYQVSLDSDRPLWVLTVQNQKLPWISVNDPGGLGGAAPRSYNVQGVPANVLIDREGNIVGRNISTDALGERLPALLK